MNPSYYVTIAVKRAAPPSALRGRDADYGKLSRIEQIIVKRVINGEWPTNNLSPREETFLRRYHGE